ncbi:MBL fold metallo-hydrolase [Nibrella saemangeumensis]
MIAKISLGLLGLILVAGVIAVAIGYSISGPKYTGPVSDHFDGQQFFNPNQVEPRGFKDVLSWMLNRDRTEWAPYRDVPPGPPPPNWVPGQDLRVTFVNHSSVLLQFDSLNVLTDPVWSYRPSPFTWIGPKRNRPPGIRLEDLPPIDIILLSHSHWDHLDLPTLRQLVKRDKPRIFCPLGVKALLDREGFGNISEMDWNQSQPFNERTRIHCVPAQHFSGRGMFDRNATLWCGFVVDNQTAGKLHFAGDTGYGQFFKQIGKQYGPMRLALIPIGAYKPTWFMAPVHCSPAEAVEIHKDVCSQQSIGIHYGTFPLADEGETEPVTDLRKALQQQGIPPEKFQALEEGKGVVF